MRPWLFWLLVGDCVVVTTLLVIVGRLPPSYPQVRWLILSAAYFILAATPLALLLPQEQLKVRWSLLRPLLAELILGVGLVFALSVLPARRRGPDWQILWAMAAFLMLTPIPVLLLFGLLDGTLEGSADGERVHESRGELEVLTRLKRRGLLDRLARHIRDSTARVGRRFKLPKATEESGSAAGASLDHLVKLKRHGSFGPDSSATGNRPAT